MASLGLQNGDFIGLRKSNVSSGDPKLIVQALQDSTPFDNLSTQNSFLSGKTTTNLVVAGKHDLAIICVSNGSSAVFLKRLTTWSDISAPATPGNAYFYHALLSQDQNKVAFLTDNAGVIVYSLPDFTVLAQSSNSAIDTSHCISADGNYVFAITNDSLLELNISTNTSTTYAIPGGSGYGASIACNADGSVVYLGKNTGGTSLGKVTRAGSFVDVTTLSTIKDVSRMVANPSGTKVACYDITTDNVKILNTSTFTLDSSYGALVNGGSPINGEFTWLNDTVVYVAFQNVTPGIQRIELGVGITLLSDARAEYVGAVTGIPTVALQYEVNGTISAQTASNADWIAQAISLPTGRILGKVEFSGTSFTIPVPSQEVCTISVFPNIKKVWEPNTAKIIGDRIYPTDVAAVPYYYKCTTAGTTAGVEPVFPTSAGTVTDNGCVWTFQESTIDGAVETPIVPTVA